MKGRAVGSRLAGNHGAEESVESRQGRDFAYVDTQRLRLWIRSEKVWAGKIKNFQWPLSSVQVVGSLELGLIDQLVTNLI